MSKKIFRHHKEADFNNKDTLIGFIRNDAILPIFTYLFSVKEQVLRGIINL